MALSTKIIKQKIKSVGNIKKITKTMEMVSVSKMRKAVDKTLSSRIYALYALELLVNLSKNKEITHPLMNSGKNTNNELIVLVTSNKGLCGGYNTNIFKALNFYINQNKEKNIKVITVGKYSEKMAKKLALNVFASFNIFSENSTIDQTEELSRLLMQEYKEGGYGNAKILYTEFVKSTTYKPTLKKIFPLNVDSVKNLIDTSSGELHGSGDFDTDLSNYLFEPSLTNILNNILPGLVDSIVYQCLSESFASEHSARMFAMKNAGDNATTILESLTLSYNHARQDGITREISEIVGGAEALKTD
jgi:F-type H+-transporting ATPase subunit gamma